MPFKANNKSDLVTAVNGWTANQNPITATTVVYVPSPLVEW